MRLSKLIIAAGILVAIVAVVAFIFAVRTFGWDWTGFTAGASQITTTSTSHGTTTAIVKPAGKTLWDWLQLLIVPLVLTVGAFWLNQIQKSREEKTTEQRAKSEEMVAEQRAQTEREIAADNQREAALQAYIDKISELLLHEHLSTSSGPPHIESIARARTATVLRILDPVRRGSLIRFLSQAGILTKCIEDELMGIDLRGANLDHVSLSKINLHETNLSGADLSGADLSGANLSTTVALLT